MLEDYVWWHSSLESLWDGWRRSQRDLRGLKDLFGRVGRPEEVLVWIGNIKRKCSILDVGLISSRGQSKTNDRWGLVLLEEPVAMG